MLHFLNSESQLHVRLGKVLLMYVLFTLAVYVRWLYMANIWCSRSVYNRKIQSYTLAQLLYYLLKCAKNFCFQRIIHASLKCITSTKQFPLVDRKIWCTSSTGSDFQDFVAFKIAHPPKQEVVTAADPLDNDFPSPLTAITEPDGAPIFTNPWNIADVHGIQEEEEVEIETKHHPPIFVSSISDDPTTRSHCLPVEEGHDVSPFIATTPTNPTSPSRIHKNTRAATNGYN